MPPWELSPLCGILGTPALNQANFRRFAGILRGIPLAFQQGMEFRRQPLGANTPINVDGDRGADKAYVVDDVNVPAPIAWEVLTVYEGIGLFVSSIRHSTIKEREPRRELLEQHGVGRAWIISLPMHVVLDVREHAQRVLAFRDVCGKSFSTYVKQSLDEVREEMLTRGAR